MAEITTVYTYPLDGSTTEWPINFEYLARRFVVVTLIGQDRKELVLNSDYRFVTATAIKTTKAWGPADDYDYIEIKRVTSATDRVVTFSDGSILRATDLNLAQIQTMHVAEEARNAVTDTIGVDTNGQLDARARRIVNVADAVDSGDAVNLRMMEQWDESALNSRNAAAASQAAALVSQNAAKVSETNAKTSETNAKTSATNSETSAAAAHNWAAAPEDTVVAYAGYTAYSSYHYSQKSAKSAANSSITAAESLASQKAAATSEANAATSEANAATSEQNAKAWAGTVNLPAASGHGGQMLRQMADESGYEFVPDYTEFGLGDYGPMVGPNAVAQAQGFYRWAAGDSGAPVATTGYRGAYLNLGYTFSERTQLAFDPATNEAYMRQHYSVTEGAWRAWVRMVHSGNAPGLPLSDPNVMLAAPHPSVTDPDVDYNSITSEGWYYKLIGTSTNANRPAGGYFYLQVLRYSNTENVTQIAYPYGTGSQPGAIWWRSAYGGVWSSWQRTSVARKRKFVEEILWDSTVGLGQATPITLSRAVEDGEMLHVNFNRDDWTKNTQIAPVIARRGGLHDWPFGSAFFQATLSADGATFTPYRFTSGYPLFRVSTYLIED